MPRQRSIVREIIAGLKEVEKDRQGKPAKLVTYRVRLPNIKALRQKLKLTQTEFARRYCLNARTVQDWEQGRAQPDPMVRAYLTVIAHNPRAVEKALAMPKA
ncbi:MAG: helix-turn-helix domain-containing protein [Rhodospirillaceae bacterium]|nr:helix-turn-helix domain-containing protein [Rhodospirillaceae bacterium]